jgi:hypothetical protein
MSNNLLLEGSIVVLYKTTLSDHSHYNIYLYFPSLTHPGVTILYTWFIVCKLYHVIISDIHCNGHVTLSNNQSILTEDIKPKHQHLCNFHEPFFNLAVTNFGCPFHFPFFLFFCFVCFEIKSTSRSLTFLDRVILSCMLHGNTSQNYV